MSGLEFVGLASNVLQFLEFGIKVSSRAKALYNSASGFTVDHEALEADVLRFTTLVEQVKQSRATSKAQAYSVFSSNADKTLWETAASCELTAKDLIALLSGIKLKSQSRKNFVHVFQKAFKGELVKEKIEVTDRRLAKLQNALFLSVQLVSLNQQSAILSIVKELKAKGDKQDTRFTAGLEKLIQDKILKDQHDAQKPTIADLADVLDDFAIKATNARKQQDILSSLYFTTLRERHARIKDAHEVTLRWIESDKKESMANFSLWLESPNREIYWVQGKAGSGKSTLMKALVASKDTKKQLLRWTGSDPLFIASHFFWTAGNLMQQSMLGLLQTLVYQIFKQCPDIIELSCPSRWAASSGHKWIEPWNQAELNTVLEAITSQQVLPSKFCFFIDGLDEYTDGAKRFQGSFTELVGLLRRLASSPSIKICVSSRPWPVFEEALGLGKWQLKLQDLTKRDIELYVQTSLGNNPEYQRISRKDAKCAEIAPTIVERANGVWLWVFLVVEQILKGMSNHDTYKTLKRRLDDLPHTLDEYFSHMLESIEPVYWEETNRIFRVMVAAGQALPLLSFNFVLQEIDDTDYALDMNIKAYNSDSLAEIYKTEKARIKARCHDLLHVSSSLDNWEQTIQFKVDFLHRTVKDFFAQANILDNISKTKSRSAEEDFNPFISLCRIHLALSKALPFHDQEHPDPNQVFAFADGLMYYAWNVEIRADNGFRDKQSSRDLRLVEQDQENGQGQSLQTVFDLLDELDRTNEQLVSKHIGEHWTNAKEPPNGLFLEYGNKTFLAAAIQAHLAFYVERKLGDDPRAVVASKKGRPLLDYALRPTIVTPLPLLGFEEGPAIKIVELLLERGGADPNKGIYIYDDKSPWELFLMSCREDTSSRAADGSDIAGALVDAMLLLIRHGADIDACIYDVDNEGKSVLDVARKIQVSPVRIDRLQQLIEDKRAERRNRSMFLKIVSFIWGG